KALREHRGRAPDVAHTAMEYRGGKSLRIEHGAATDGERIGLPIDMTRREVLENSLHAIVLVLDGLAARTDANASHHLHRGGVRGAIVGDTAGKLRPCKCHAVVDEHGETLRPGRRARHQHLTKTRIARIKKIAREMDWIVVSNRERLRERFRPRNVEFRVEHRRAPSPRCARAVAAFFTGASKGVVFIDTPRLSIKTTPLDAPVKKAATARPQPS